METVHTATLEFRAMACAARVVVVGGTPAHVALARTAVEHLEQCWSRFLPNSDISRLNAAGGRPISVDPATITLITAMVQGWARTEGAFDPTLLAPLLGLGYAVSWDNPAHVTSLAAGTSLRTRPTDIEIDGDRCVVRAPSGSGLDAGGIGKGLAADLVVEQLLAAGAEGALVSIGGDLRVGGRAPQRGGWTIDVVNPFDDALAEARLTLTSGGVATSGTVRRAWVRPDGSAAHHLLDPATAEPVSVHAADALIEATVVAGTGAWAEVFTKAVLVRGAEAGLPWLDSLGLACRARFADGTELTNDAWDAFAAEGLAQPVYQAHEVTA